MAKILQERAGIKIEDSHHMRFMGEKYFNRMIFEKQVETLEINLTQQVDTLTQGIFKRYS